MTFALSGLYVLGWIVALLWPRGGHDAIEVLTVMTFLYSVSIALLIGSHASAEERQFGTLPSQLLLPLASSTQWAVKVTVALALSWLVTIGLPALLAFLGPAIDGVVPSPTHLIAERTLLSILLTVAGLYVSSLSTSGVRAVMAALPALFGAGMLIRFAIAWTGKASAGSIHRVGPDTMPWLIGLTAVGLSVLVLRFALANHRSADRTAARIVGQVAWIAGALTVAVTLLARADGF
jgi:hypothetical protein